jgi:integrase
MSPLTHLSREVLFCSNRTRARLAPRTVALVLNVIKGALSAAVRQRVLAANPATGVTVRGGGAVSKAGAALTADEMTGFLAHDPAHRLHALWHVAAYTGVRPGELLALRWQDVDLDGATLHVQRTLVRIGGQMYYAPCKAGSAREVPLVPAEGRRCAAIAPDN